jgi:hypothetical protein
MLILSTARIGGGSFFTKDNQLNRFAASLYGRATEISPEHLQANSPAPNEISPTPPLEIPRCHFQFTYRIRDNSVPGENSVVDLGPSATNPPVLKRSLLTGNTPSAFDKGLLR